MLKVKEKIEIKIKADLINGNENEPANANPFHLYLKDVGESKLLSHKEMTDIFKSIKSLEKKIKTADVKSKEKYELALIEKRNKIINANLRLVLFIAFRVRREIGDVIDFKSMVSAGNVGLFKAVHGFDPQKKFKFSTYAFKPVWQSIINAIEEEGRIVSLTEGARKNFVEIYKFKKRYFKENGFHPSDAEIASELKMPLEKFLLLSGFIRRDPVSLEIAVRKEILKNRDYKGVIRFSDLIRADEELQPEILIEERQKKDIAKKILSLLTPQEEKIMRLKFGIGTEELTFEEIGKIFGISKQRVQQIHAETIEKLRNFGKIQKLNPF